jgi:hypothetical protein
MSQFKLYLSKSKAAGVKEIIRLESILSEIEDTYGSFDLLEFEASGGSYSSVHDRNLLTAHSLLLLPPASSKASGGSITVGKGQHHMLKTYTDQHGWGDVYMITGVGGYDADISHVNRMSITGNDFTSDYARVFFDTITYHTKLEAYMEEMIDHFSDEDGEEIDLLSENELDELFAKPKPKAYGTIDNITIKDGKVDIHVRANDLMSPLTTYNPYTFKATNNVVPILAVTLLSA